MVSGNRPNGNRGTENRRVALLVQYDGTHFNGWQIQKRGRTVQGEIERALSILFRVRVRVIAAGRTDSGTHALGQVIHFDASGLNDLRKITNGLNGILERDISIKNAFFVPSDFHARFSAVERGYFYLIYNHPFRSPFMNSRAMWFHDKLDIEYIKEVSGYLLGERDFASFCKKISSDGNTVRRIIEIDVSSVDELIIFRIRGNAFLHNMIRVMMGTIIEMYKNKRPPEHILRILDSRDRDMSGVTAPSCGLYLYSVVYDPPLETMESAY